MRNLTFFTILLSCLTPRAVCAGNEAEFDICANPFWIDTLDEDKDGNIDILTLANKQNLFKFGRAFGNGSGGLSECKVLSSAMPLSLHPVTGGVVFRDFDHDGFQDILCVDGSRNPV